MDTIRSIAATIFKIKPEEVNDAMSSETMPNWDSMNYLLFISELEKAFAVSFSMDEVLSAKNLGEIKNYLRAKGVAI